MYLAVCFAPEQVLEKSSPEGLSNTFSMCWTMLTPGHTRVRFLLFFSRHKELSEQIIHDGKATYLRGAHSCWPSPLSIGAAISRLFRVLPISDILLELGRDGFARMLATQRRLARRIAAYLFARWRYDLLPRAADVARAVVTTFVNLTVSGAGRERQQSSVRNINGTSRMYVGGTLEDARYRVSEPTESATLW